MTLMIVFMLIMSVLADDCQPTLGKGVGVQCQTTNSHCFPEGTNIITKAKGIIKMEQLQIGDEVLSTVAGCTTCEHFYTKITGWLHRDPDIRSEYLEIVDNEEQSFFVSPMHNLATENGSYVFAKNAGKYRLFGWKNYILKILRLQKKGAYAPMTSDGTYFILKSNGDKVLAHCFANVANPTTYEPIVRIALSLYDKVFGASNEKIHPVASWFMKQLSFLVEE